MVVADSFDGDGGWQRGMVSHARCHRFSVGYGIPPADRRTDPSPAYRHRQARGYAVASFQDCHAGACRHHPQPARRNGCRRGLRRSRQWCNKHLTDWCRRRVTGYCHSEHSRGGHHLHADASRWQQPLALVYDWVAEWSR